MRTVRTSNPENSGGRRTAWQSTAARVTVCPPPSRVYDGTQSAGPDRSIAARSEAPPSSTSGACPAGGPGRGSSNTRGVLVTITRATDPVMRAFR